MAPTFYITAVQVRATIGVIQGLALGGVAGVTAFGNVSRIFPSEGQVRNFPKTERDVDD